MTRPSPRRGTALALLLAVLASALGLLGGSTAQAATTVTVVITNGSTPAVTNAAVGDRIVFRNASANATFFVTGSFTTGAIPAGRSSAASPALKAGRFDYVVSLGGLVPSGGGTVVATAADAPAPAPTTGAPAASPTTPSLPGIGQPSQPSQPAPTTPGAAPGAVPGSPVPSGSATAAPQTGGSGVALTPRLDTGSLLLPAPTDGSGGPAPQLAPDQLGGGLLPPVDGGSLTGAFPQNGDSTTQDGSTIDEDQALTTRLNDADGLRQYGLPTVLGVVLALGAASLVVRVLLATTTLRAWLHGQGPLSRTA